MRPFYCPFTDNHRQYGIHHVKSTDETVYEIDGELYIGQAGLEAIVTRQLSSDPIGTYGKDDISIGQRVLIFGTLQEGEDLVLDATTDDSAVRMLLTTVRGTAMAIDDAAGQLTVDLQTVDHRFAGIFDFAGTNSDPGNYEIDTATLDLSIVEPSSPVKARGFVAPFGSAPPDFSARTIVAVADLTALMKVHWNPATDNAFESVTTDGLTLNLEGVGRFHHILRGHAATHLTLLEVPVAVRPQADAQGTFVLCYPDGAFQVYLEYSDFMQALITDLGEGNRVKMLHAVGHFDDTSATQTSKHIEVKYAAASPTE